MANLEAFVGAELQSRDSGGAAVIVVVSTCYANASGFACATATANDVLTGGGEVTGLLGGLQRVDRQLSLAHQGRNMRSELSQTMGDNIGSLLEEGNVFLM